MKKNPRFDRKSFGTTSPAAADKRSSTKPAGSVFKSNPVYKGDGAAKTYGKPGGMNQQ